MALGDWAISDIKVSLPAARKGTPVLAEQFPHTLFIFGHYTTTRSCRRDKKARVAGRGV
jgi:hypothetical protein